MLKQNSYNKMPKSMRAGREQFLVLGNTFRQVSPRSLTAPNQWLRGAPIQRLGFFPIGLNLK